MTSYKCSCVGAQCKDLDVTRSQCAADLGLEVACEGWPPPTAWHHLMLGGTAGGAGAGGAYCSVPVGSRKEPGAALVLIDA